MRDRNRMHWLTLLLAGALILAACGGPATTAAPAEPPQPEEPTAAPPEEPTAEPMPEFHFALITPNPLGDRSFIDASARGVERANTELGLSGQIIETNSIAEQETAIRAALAQGNDLILALAPWRACRRTCRPSRSTCTRAASWSGWWPG
jgi:basic membrane protein A